MHKTFYDSVKRFDLNKKMMPSAPVEEGNKGTFRPSSQQQIKITPVIEPY
jgi:hypothetical protein